MRSLSFRKITSIFLSFHLLVIQATFIAVAVVLTSCASEPGSQSVQDSKQVKETQSGLATFIGESFEGKKTASGEILNFDKKELVAAHPSYPMGTVVRVTNLDNQRVAEVRVIDRSSTPKNREEGVIIDVSPVVAERLGFVKEGKVRVRTEVLEWGDKSPDKSPDK
ncbi:septal ring lytic transglycosylase RlpA family protein [Mastigocladopsis repens]|uniref:septal ring lytic transglycosylase RlpA family protein n=1 Tax=Mastigocladopsis repens TaxID=221287 RepID=UPI0003604F11|nr:septal ring lytic transglycosylase RlpA family protein [Mastigocladopsis repens]